MRFKKIRIENFRGIKQAEVDGLSMVNVFLGQNNCGKTSLLEGIFLLSGYNNANLIVIVDNIRQLIHTENNDFSFVFNNLNYSNKLTIHAETDSKDIIDLNIIPKSSTGQTRIINGTDQNVDSIKENYKTPLSSDTNSNSYIDQLEFKTTLNHFTSKKLKLRL